MSEKKIIVGPISKKQKAEKQKKLEGNN